MSTSSAMSTFSGAAGGGGPAAGSGGLAGTVGCGAGGPSHAGAAGAARTGAAPTLVILDAVHHGGDALSWGDAVREALEGAPRLRVSRLRAAATRSPAATLSSASRR